MPTELRYFLTTLNYSFIHSLSLSHSLSPPPLSLFRSVHQKENADGDQLFLVLFPPICSGGVLKREMPTELRYFLTTLNYSLSLSLSSPSLSLSLPLLSLSSVQCTKRRLPTEINNFWYSSHPYVRVVY